MATKKKVLVVDDSAFMRTIISDLIVRDPSFEIAGTARHGLEAVDKVKELKPDAVTLDVEMPVQNGLEALRRIMAEAPTPVIMLSSLTEEGRSETLSALEYGAYDFVCKPSPAGGTGDIHKVGEMLIEKLHTAIASEERRRQLEELRQQRLAREASLTSKAMEPSRPIPREKKPLSLPDRSHQAANNRDEITSSRLAKKAVPQRLHGYRKGADQELDVNHRSMKPVADPVPEAKPLSRSNVEKPGVRGMKGRTTSFEHIIAIGTSTGGPRALKQLLTDLPKGLPAPVLIVQHMPPNFTKSLAERLNTYSELEVREAQDGEVLQAGVAYIAPGGLHMTATKKTDGNYAISLNKSEPRSGHRPSVDMLFESLLPFHQLERHIVLLTGMGSDGARMMRQLADEGVTSTFVESEESCVVFGMPRAAIELGCVSHIVPLRDMAGAIMNAVK
ncbi:chemotaxis response regulator protein-glutamate methylesterase [Paenibacillus profundus]|uniref:Protein-glutamate methylesterase/protein-glutamine glutaminase n=1 Tax=Paenibacillus profundus TaxID=1173085 RepID=A0ABS8YCK1_9BACL|nr:chemotaxis response regulator protein-glutamate methylesterase [Paenibacillus profundus]MCE5168075.1 chemotaxis response regulator protein-glutamate methylesterase [Paenibacillus profundus]